jgi:hypothetical protein
MLQHPRSEKQRLLAEKILNGEPTEVRLDQFPFYVVKNEHYQKFIELVSELQMGNEEIADFLDVPIDYIDRALRNPIDPLYHRLTAGRVEKLRNLLEEKQKSNSPI